MSLFTLLKISRTRHLLGKKQVPPETPGAVKVVEVSKFWYAYRREGKKQIKVKLFTDKAASLSKLAKLNTAFLMLSRQVLSTCSQSTLVSLVALDTVSIN